MSRSAILWANHIIKEHVKRNKSWVDCHSCRFYYCLFFVVLISPLINKLRIEWYKNNKQMDNKFWETVVMIFFSLFAFVLATTTGIIVKHYLEKDKFKAETESIKLKNKITKDITYRQLKIENQHKNISADLKIFQQILDLKEKVASEKNLAEKEKQQELWEELKDSFKRNVASASEEEKNEEEKPKKLKK